MIISILKFVLFSIIICSYEYAQNELYFINEASKYLERNIINFRNNRVLADADNLFDLNNFYESTFSLANKFSDYIDDDEEITNLRNAIDSHIKNYKERNTLPNLNVDEKTKKLIHELQKEFEEVKTELDNIRNDKIPIQPIQEKGITKKDDNFKETYIKYIISEKRRKEVNNTKNLEKEEMKLFMQLLLLVVGILMIAGLGPIKLLLLLAPLVFLMCKTGDKISKYRCKLRFPYR
ncbi:fam-b protein [Plasmodium vinckei petteri]|uniref:Fam-b protein n=1 Tax=Plasmodium vinckei petteri TaxID=138298 RepID=A0A6V7TD88_PLAVN|nr:fam-b protein [Plasmodium vinckei petteri]